MEKSERGIMGLQSVPWADAKLILLGSLARTWDMMRLLATRFWPLIALWYVVYFSMLSSGLITRDIFVIVLAAFIALLARSSMVRKDWRYIVMSPKIVVAAVSLFIGTKLWELLYRILLSVSYSLFDWVPIEGGVYERVTHSLAIFDVVLSGLLILLPTIFTMYYLLDAHRPISECLKSIKNGFRASIVFLKSFSMLCSMLLFGAIFCGVNFLVDLGVVPFQNTFIYSAVARFQGLIFLGFLLAVLWYVVFCILFLLTFFAATYEYIRYRDEV